MREQKEKRMADGRGILSIPSAILDAAGIPADSGLTIETIPGVVLIADAEPLRRANRPYVRLFSDLGIELEEVQEILVKGGYLDGKTDL